MYHLWKFRFEVKTDAQKFQNHVRKLNTYGIRDGILLDYVSNEEAEFRSNLSYSDLLILIYESVPDSYVMYQTLAPKNKYTGDRNYEIDVKMILANREKPLTDIEELLWIPIDDLAKYNPTKLDYIGFVGRKIQSDKLFNVSDYLEIAIETKNDKFIRLLLDNYDIDLLETRELQRIRRVYKYLHNLINLNIDIFKYYIDLSNPDNKEYIFESVVTSIQPSNYSNYKNVANNILFLIEKYDLDPYKIILETWSLFTLPRMEIIKKYNIGPNALSRHTTLFIDFYNKFKSFEDMDKLQQNIFLSFLKSSEVQVPKSTLKNLYPGLTTALLMIKIRKFGIDDEIISSWIESEKDKDNRIILFYLAEKYGVDLSNITLSKKLIGKIVDLSNISLLKNLIDKIDNLANINTTTNLSTLVSNACNPNDPTGYKEIINSLAAMQYQNYYCLRYALEMKNGNMIKDIVNKLIEIDPMFKS